MRTPVYAGLLFLGFAASAAYAAKISITGNVSQTVSGSDNFFLNNHPAGPTYDSITALALHFLARTPVTEYHLDTNISYFTYFGQGASDTNTKTGAPMGANFNVNHRSDPLTRWNFGTSWQRVDVAGTQLAETGQATVSGFSDTYTARAGVSHDLNARDTVSLQSSASTVSFSAPGQTPYSDVNTTAAWAHRFGPLIRWNNSLYFDYFADQDVGKTKRLFWRATSGLEVRLTPRLSTHGSVGWIFANSYATASGAVGPVSLGLFPTGAGNSPVWDLGLSYDLTKTTSAAVSVSQAVTPTILGDLQKSTAVQGGITHRVNSRSSVSFTSQYSRLIGAQNAGTSDLFTAGLSYSYSLTKELRAAASYTFITRHDSTGTARSNTVLLSLSRQFTALP